MTSPERTDEEVRPAEGVNPFLKAKIFCVISGCCAVGGVIMVIVGTVQNEMNYRLLRIAFVTEFMCLFFATCSVVIFFKNKRQSPALYRNSYDLTRGSTTTDVSISVISEATILQRNSFTLIKDATNTEFQPTIEIVPGNGKETNPDNGVDKTTNSGRECKNTQSEGTMEGNWM